MLSETLAQVSQPLALTLPGWVWGALLGAIFGIMSCIHDLRKPTEYERKRIRAIASRTESPESAELIRLIERLSGERFRCETARKKLETGRIG